jgi:hypothetical protein
MRRRWFLLGLAAVPVGWAIRFALSNRVVIVNSAGQPVRALTVTVCGESFHFADIPPGGSVSARFGTPQDESGFEVRRQLADGTAFNDACGYVVWEDFGRRFHLVIQPSGAVSCDPGA